ncbi:uncharacterized protein LOC141719818 [Apium graveolens]|uniref:uncharacterized protein LOC141719818 n=1 Tax=Apium graveolens TaxID=4045 RepID=UPI003D79ED99
MSLSFPFDLNLPAEETGQTHEEEDVHHHKSRAKLSCDSRMQIVIWLLNNQIEGKLKHGAIQEVTTLFNVTRRTISTIWEISRRQNRASQPYNMSTNGHNSGRKRIQVQPSTITGINMGDRACIRDLAVQLKRVYLERNEKGKYRVEKSSKFIPKVMFTAAIARPRFNQENTECTFDGKIGIFSFTYQEPARRASKYRAKGTVVTKVVESVGRKETRSMLINDIIPAIMQKWPVSEGHKTIYIQQDNARTHITQDDPEWQQVHKQGDFTFYMVQQPPNSPDLNILDLGFFRSIQSLMHKKMPKDVDDMLNAVHQAFYELDPRTLANVWLSYQYVMNEVLKVKGSNDYLVPHVNKKN